MAENVWSRIFKTGLSYIVLAGIVLLVLALTVGPGAARSDNTAMAGTGDDENNIEADEGPIGPGNALYGLQIAFENIGETFTFNESEKLGKQVAHARKRIAEARAELKKGNAKAAERALEKFDEKNAEAESLISSSSDVNSGLLHAQEMIKKHQQVLYNLTLLYPDNPGLARAYANSLKLEQKFNEKISEREEEEGSDEGNLKIKAEISGNDTEVKVSVNFKSDNVTNFTIANEILGKFQLSAENINTLLTVENMDDGELKTELGAEAKIGEGFSIVKAEYKFPLLNTTSRDGIVDGIYMNLHALTIENVTNVLEIENMTKVSENKKEATREIKKEMREEKKQLQEDVREEKKQLQEEMREEKTAIKQQKREDKENDR